MQAYEDNESFILMIPPPYKFIKICDIPMLSLPHCLLIALPKHPSCPVSSMENQFQGPKFDQSLPRELQPQLLPEYSAKVLC